MAVAPGIHSISTTGVANVLDLLRYKMQPSTASIPPRILLLFADLRSYGFSKLFGNKSIA